MPRARRQPTSGRQETSGHGERENGPAESAERLQVVHRHEDAEKEFARTQTDDATLVKWAVRFACQGVRQIAGGTPVLMGRRNRRALYRGPGELLTYRNLIGWSYADQNPGSRVLRRPGEDVRTAHVPFTPKLEQQQVQVGPFGGAFIARPQQQQCLVILERNAHRARDVYQPAVELGLQRRPRCVVAHRALDAADRHREGDEEEGEPVAKPHYSIRPGSNAERSLGVAKRIVTIT